MKAIRISSIGGRLTQSEIPEPRPAAGEVRVAVKAAGICHSDAHYRSGVGSLADLPITPGHEVAGIIDAVGPGVGVDRVGERVCLHYLVTCGDCEWCHRRIGQFCDRVMMIGKDRDGGYAEYICVPGQNAVTVPDEVPLAHAAIMMCSFATALHALRKARFAAGESVAVFGVGGLGTAAIDLARALGASRIVAVDRNPAKLAAARSQGAIDVDAGDSDVVSSILAATDGRGIDVALELVGQPVTSQQAVRSLGVQGRAAMVALTSMPTQIDMYADMIGKEREIIGVSDHLPEEIDELFSLVRQGRLDVGAAVSRVIPLEEQAVNEVFDELDSYAGEAIRTVITLE